MVARAPSGPPSEGAELTLLVLASAFDEQARALVECWGTHGARLLTPADLASPGWSYRVGRDDDTCLVAGGDRIPVRDVAGILVRLSAVSPLELVQIEPGDRAYVAAEMHAFLLAWLTDAPCPVLNRPSATCLSGPWWRAERWAWEAGRLGIPSRPVCRAVTLDAAVPTPDATDHPAVSVVVVGGEWVGEVDPVLGMQARRLAAAAGADLLGVRFTQQDGAWRFTGAETTPDPLAPPVEDAILAYFRRRGPRTPEAAR